MLWVTALTVASWVTDPATVSEVMSALQAIVPGLTAIMVFLAVYAFALGGRGAFKRPPQRTAYPSAFELFALWFARIAVWLLPVCVVGWLVIGVALLL